MTTFRDKTAALAFALALLAASAQAQTPSQDVPQPTADEPAPVDVQPGVPVERPGADVTVNTLGTLDGPAVGLLDATNGGFDPNMWSASSRADIEDLLSRIPLVSPDPAIRVLARRLVLTQADAPTGPAHRALITIRIEKLLQAGMIDEAGALAARAELKDDPDFARVQADAILMAGRDADACGDKTATRLTSSELFWLQLRATCAAAAGDTATAELTLNVIDAEGSTDKAFGELLNGAKKLSGPIAKPTAIHVFLLRKAGLPIGEDVAGVMGTSANLLALRDQRNPPQARLAAAERIVGTGALGANDLRDVADAQPLAAEGLVSAFDAARTMPFLTGQILLLRAAQLESRPPEKSKLILEALELGAKAHLLQVTTALFAKTAATTDWDLHERAWLALTGNVFGGEPSSSLVDDNRPNTEFLLDLIAPNPARDAAFRGFPDADLKKIAAQPQNVESADVLGIGLYEALGHDLPPDAAASIAAARAYPWPGRRPDADAMQKLKEAASAPGRKGEAILRILDIAGANGPGDLAPDVAVELVRTLKQLGLDDEARGFAVDAMLLHVSTQMAPPPQAPPAAQ